MPRCDDNSPNTTEFPGVPPAVNSVTGGDGGGAVGVVDVVGGASGGDTGGVVHDAKSATVNPATSSDDTVVIDFFISHSFIHGSTRVSIFVPPNGTSPDTHHSHYP